MNQSEYTRNRRSKRRLIYILRFNLILAIILQAFLCWKCFLNLDVFIRSFSFNFFICIAFDLGHSWLIEKIDTRISWIEAPFKRLFIGVTLMLAYSFIVSLGFVAFFNIFIFKQIDLEQIEWIKVFEGATLPVYISTAMVTIFTSWSFLMSWRQTAIDAEKLKRDNLQAQYDSLKNQINPHFLFNSFNVLTDLVYINQDLAAKFIQQLSEVFRYVLETSKKEFVPLQTELEFLKSYVFLVKIRFGDNLIINIPDKGSNKIIIPLGLQMLIENAIKHNIISSDDPLTVDIEITDERVIVKNNLQRKNTVEHSTGLGLANIKARYEHLKSEKIEIEETKDYFKVGLPLLNEKIYRS